MQWNEPIYDRTQADVNYALQKIAEWLKGNIAGNASSVKDLKGCLNVSDINRIEGNIEYLGNLLADHGYRVSVFTKSWTNNDLPNQGDVERILNNVRSLLDSYYTHPASPSIPDKMLSYEDVNAVEQSLFLIKELLDCMVASSRTCDTFQSGSTIRLPLRR